MSFIENRLLDYSAGDECAKEGELQERILKIMRSMNSRTKHSVPKKSVIGNVKNESDEWCTNKGLNNNDLYHDKSSATECYGTFEPDCVDRSVRNDLAVLLHGTLLRGQETVLKRKILLPQDMLQNLATDIMNMAQSEPYGLRGAVIYLNLVNDEGTHSLGRIECNSHVASTFEVKVTLVEDVKRWCTLKDLLIKGLFSCKKTEIYLAPGYKLAKHKLYRSNAAYCC